MGVVRLPEELQDAVEREVAEGRAESAEAFVEEAVRGALGLLEEPAEELLRLAEDGAADIAAGRYVEVSSEAQHGALAEEVAASVRMRLGQKV